MDILARIQKKLEMAEVRAENLKFEKKFGKFTDSKNIPSMYTGTRQDDKVVKEIKGTVTGKTIAFEREDGSYIWAGTDHHQIYTDEQGRKQIASVKSPATEEYEAMQALSYPIFNGSSGL